jgi:predicted transcriptional regulator
MSMYAVVLTKLRGDVSGKTKAQLATALNVPEQAIEDAITMLVRDGRVTDTDGTYTVTANRDDR